MERAATGAGVDSYTEERSFLKASALCSCLWRPASFFFLFLFLCLFLVKSAFNLFLMSVNLFWFPVRGWFKFDIFCRCIFHSFNETEWMSVLFILKSFLEENVELLFFLLLFFTFLMRRSKGLSIMCSISHKQMNTNRQCDLRDLSHHANKMSICT